jgi:EpsI family protein
MLFGWVFFGAVIIVLFWFASFWRDAEDGGAVIERSLMPSSRGLITGTAAGAVALAAAWPLYAAHLDRSSAERDSLELAAVPAVGGWTSDAASLTEWRPHYVGAAASRFTVYRKGENAVALYIGYYRDQRQGAELIGWQNAIVQSENRAWASAGESARSVELESGALRVRETRLRGAGQRLLVWDWYRISGRDTSNPYLAKALLARDRLIGRGDDSAAVVLAAPYGARPGEGAQALAEFARDMLPAIHATLIAATAADAQ